MGHFAKARRAAVAALILTTAAFVPAYSVPAFATGERAAVASILDGDSFVLQGGLVVRLAGIEAPRLRSSDAASVAARDGLAALVAGKTVQLRYGGLRRDSRGRALAQVMLQSSDGGTIWVQEALLRQGHARVHTYADNRAGVEDLWRAERSARQASLGVWQVPAYQIRYATPEALAGAANSFQLFEGRVVSAERRGSVIYLNFGEDQQTDVTATIPERSWPLWNGGQDTILGLEGRVIRVRGFMRNSNGPSVWVDHPEQVEYIIETQSGQRGRRLR
ncbi:MAG: thermonuclease family protein [Hyphomonadaceae bacterium]|jgi:endonuclease YncB( thermonuclease family)|nr:thermonuclease family protein [Hyphomonadaceae bacterium]